MEPLSEHALLLAEALLEYCGIDPEGFREANKALITLDYEAVVIVAVDGSLIHLAALLGEAPDSPKLHRNLLNKNFDALAERAYRYAIDPQSGELVMSLCVGSEGLETDEFIRLFISTVDYANLWQRSLYTGGEDVPAPDGGSPPPPDPHPDPGLRSSPGGPLRA